MSLDFQLTCPLSIPSQKILNSALNSVIEVLKAEDECYRPIAKNKKNGAFIQLENQKNTVLVPDLHARYDFLAKILNCKIYGCTVLESLEQNKLNLIFVGDGLHSERRGFTRWIEAMEEFDSEIYDGPSMTHEMQEGLNTMLLIMKLKCEFPSSVHFLKGNHENIMNSGLNGNHPFFKFAAEGLMSHSFMKTTYGSKTLKLYDQFEKLLPLFVKGNGYLVSHAEPLVSYSREQLINGYSDDALIEGLTWTRNNEAVDNPAISMLREFFPNDDTALYFAGHRPVSGQYNTREEGKFIQIHNPEKQQIFLLKNGKSINFDKNIIDLG